MLSANQNAACCLLQDSVLFHDTIFYNLQYGKTDATTQEVFEAARMAEIHHSIQGMPQKYETQVGERGLKLSGQWPPFVIFLHTRKLCY